MSATTARGGGGAAAAADELRLEVLYEEQPEADGALPAGLRSRYGGGLALEPPRLYANFVSSLDGVVAIEPLPEASGKLISGHSPADRFVMGLLRAAADAVLVAAGTVRASPRGLWTPDTAYPAAAGDYAELRRRRGLGGAPRLVVVTASGRLDPAHPAFERGALVLTTEGGASALRGRLPSASTVCALGDGDRLDAARIVAAVTADGHRTVLTEGGPHLIAGLLEARLLDDVFLTLSPVIAGRGPGDRRLALVEGVRLLPDTPIWPRLRSLRQFGSQLLLRYELPRPGDAT